MDQSKFVLSQTVRRQRDGWYSKRLANIVKRYCNEIGMMGLNDVSWIEALLEKEQIFNDLVVHLTKDFEISFVESIMSEASEFFTAKLISMEVEDEDLAE